MAEVFGTPIQQAMQRRALALWTLLHNDRRFLCHGRLLSVSFETADCVDLVMSLAHLQGSAGFENVPKDAVKLVQRPLHNAGFRTDIGTEYLAASDALRASDQAIAATRLPDEITLHSVGKSTSRATLHALAQLAMENNEWLAMEHFLRGEAHPSGFLYLADADERPIAFGGCVIHAHRLHPREEEGWWGMLCIDRAHSGKRLSLHLGAQIMRHMRVNFGTEQFRTIVRPGQDGFKGLCTQLGFRNARQSAIYVQDPSGFGTG